MTQKDNGPGLGRNYGETGVFTFGRKVVFGLKMGLTPKNHPKLRVVAPLKWEWQKTAKNRGEPQKMTPSSETEIFLGVVPMGKL